MPRRYAARAGGARDRGSGPSYARLVPRQAPLRPCARTIAHTPGPGIPATVAALRARVPIRHHDGHTVPEDETEKEIVMHDTNIETATVTVCENMALFGASPERDEFDSRENLGRGRRHRSAQ